MTRERAAPYPDSGRGAGLAVDASGRKRRRLRAGTIGLCTAAAARIAKLVRDVRAHAHAKANTRNTGDAQAHDRDLAIERDEGVHFERAWLDPEAGRVFCLATGPSREAVLRIHDRAGHPTPEIYELTVEV